MILLANCCFYFLYTIKEPLQIYFGFVKLLPFDNETFEENVAETKLKESIC